ncbi:MAG: hypothetical protein JJ992_18345, partial [Planctomycetes bacterium]|nr:hypothetical protein [Planctomycetota bacterium]
AGADRKPAISRLRAINIALRTAHIGVTSVLVGGHVFDVPRVRLHVWLGLTVATGAALIISEAYPRWRWFYEARGAMVILKLLLLGLIPWLWPYRVWLLAAVIVLASVGSHMPARFRYYSLLHGRMLDDPHSCAPRGNDRA